jgi:ABC-2 type transport system permease protein
MTAGAPPAGPGPATAAGRRRSPFAAVVRYTVRACLPAKRRLALVLPCAAAVLLGLLSHAAVGDREEAFATVAGVGLFPIVLPIACLMIGDAVLGAEARSGTLPFTWLSPVPFPVIVAGRWLGGTLLALVTVVPACMLAALVAGVPQGVGAMVLATAVGAAAYVALFVMIGSITRRAAVWSLAVVFLVEHLLGAALSGIAQLSPTWQSRAIYAEVGPGAEELVRAGIPQGWGAVARLAIVTVVCLAVASWRLGRLRLTGASD